MAEPHTLKVELEGDLRRFRLRLVAEDGPASQIRAIHEAISTGFTLSNEEPPLVLKYKDDEGDMCTLVEATIEDFLAQPVAKPLRLVASRRPSREPHSVQQPLPTFSTLSSASTAASSQPSVNCEATALKKEDVNAGSTAPLSRKRDASDGCHSMGPWKLLMCLRTLQDADMMSSKMVASMMLQFLPILSQRAHRKQEKLNKLGPQKREPLLGLLHSISAHLDLVEEAKPVKPLLEEFIRGSDVSRFGDFVAALFKALSSSKDRHAVSEAIIGVAPDLLESLPQLFPELFGPIAPVFCSRIRGGPPEHSGFRCFACNSEPIKGPRFSCAEAKIDLCGECFIDQGCVLSDQQQFQCFFMPPGVQPDVKAWQDGHDWKEWWKEAHHLKGEWKRQKGKGKGKGKHGKGKWHHWRWPEPPDEASEEASNSNAVYDPYTVDASGAGDCRPPGLEAASHDHSWGGLWWPLWGGKGKGKHKGKEKGSEWALTFPWGLWEGNHVHYFDEQSANHAAAMEP